MIPSAFYQQGDVVAIAHELIGKFLFTQIDGQPMTGGIITETEAYAGPHDRASHAYNNRRTKRTEVMFQAGGIAYVYLCYGIHCLLNVVTNVEGIPHAVLIRALHPVEGIDTMLARRRKLKVNPTLTIGPGALCQALGITRVHNGLGFNSSSLWIEDRGLIIPSAEITAGPRIGIDYAGEDALLPWRFLLKTALKEDIHK
jgi:DNA-3-methyladenine glycosylase